MAVGIVFQDLYREEIKRLLPLLAVDPDTRMINLVLLSATLAVALGVYTFDRPLSHGGLSDAIGIPVVSRRSIGGVKQNDVFNLVKQIVSKAHAGTTSEDLSQGAANVMALLDKLQDPDPTPVDRDAVRLLIEQSASGFGAQTAASALFDDFMTYEGEKMAAALRLWDTLVDKARAQNTAGEPTGVTLAAIRQTAEAVNSIVADTVSIVEGVLGFPSVKQGGQRRTRRALVKRGWSVGVNVGLGSHSGASVGLDFGFSF